MDETLQNLVGLLILKVVDSISEVRNEKIVFKNVVLNPLNCHGNMQRFTLKFDSANCHPLLDEKIQQV